MLRASNLRSKNYQRGLRSQPEENPTAMNEEILDDRYLLRGTGRRALRDAEGEISAGGGLGLRRLATILLQGGDPA